jgi:hypothetical protein
MAGPKMAIKPKWCSMAGTTLGAFCDRTVLPLSAEPGDGGSQKIDSRNDAGILFTV